MSLPLTESNQDQMAQAEEEVSVRPGISFTCPIFQRNMFTLGIFITSAAWQLD